MDTPTPATKVKSRQGLRLLVIGIVLFAVVGAYYFERRSHNPATGGDSLFTPMIAFLDSFIPHDYPISRDSPVERDLQSIQTMLLVYESQNGTLPSTPQGLEALVAKPVGDPVPRRWTKLMSELPLDSWGHPYGYESPGRRSGKSYDLFSNGKDGIANTADDLGNWSWESAPAKERSAKEPKKD